MSERLTYDEIIEKYPRQWVGLIDVIFEDNDDFNVKSGSNYFVIDTNNFTGNVDILIN